jgi:hypothetical protein
VYRNPAHEGVCQGLASENRSQDARLIAQMMKVDLYRAVHVKTDQSQRLRFLLTARELLLRMCASSKVPCAVPS